ncbi:MAG: MFS transporter [Halioglobus sp.]
MSPNTLSIRSKLFWGLGGLAEGVKTSAFNAFVLFYYNQILGVSATYTGIALAIAVLCDAVTDPVTGSLSDKLDSRWGRRHPFMAASALPFGLTLFLLFVPPGGMSEVFYFGWVMVFAIAVRTFMTLYYIPHLAMGPEIATDYEDRSALFSFGLFFSALGAYGFYFVMLSTVFAPSPELPNGLYRAEGFSKMSMTAGFVVCFAILLCVWGTRDQIPKLLGLCIANS